MPPIPEVSVIIPTNRVDAWLNQAVQSVLIESGLAIEVIVVLDGVASPSNEWTKDNRVRLISRPISGGPSIAMQDGIMAALGQYVARLDSDDISKPGRLMKQKAFLDTNADYSCVSAQIERIDESGLVTGQIRLPAGVDVRRQLLLYNFVSHSTLMFRRELGIKVGGYDPQLRQMEDYDFILRLGTQGPIQQLDEVLVQYRVHSGQTSKGAKARGLHIHRVITSRNALARILGQNPILTIFKNMLWRGVQFTRVLGLTRPKHLQ